MNLPAVIETIPTIKSSFVFNENVVRIEDHSEPPHIYRARVVYKNGLQLSIIFGEYTYGFSSNLFEIAIIDPESDYWRGDLFFEDEDKGDDVLGHCTVEKVQFYINKLGSLTPEKLKLMKIARLVEDNKELCNSFFVDYL